jgi:hypothetical protein
VILQTWHYLTTSTNHEAPQPPVTSAFRYLSLPLPPLSSSYTPSPQRPVLKTPSICRWLSAGMMRLVV